MHPHFMQFTDFHGYVSLRAPHSKKQQ